MNNNEKVFTCKVVVIAYDEHRISVKAKNDFIHLYFYTEELFLKGLLFYSNLTTDFFNVTGTFYKDPDCNLGCVIYNPNQLTKIEF